VSVLIRGVKNLPLNSQGYVVTIGNFDGVHLGHQALLTKVQDAARQLGLPSLAIIFEPHPNEFFVDKPVARLTRWQEKFLLMQQYGIDFVLILKFDPKLAAFTAEQFIQKILCKALQVKSLIVGDDFHFGHKRTGDFAFLTAAGKSLGFTTTQVQSILVANKRVSSTSIRAALSAGDHDLVTKLLGRPYTMRGRVVRGDGRGKTIGYPTANIYLHRLIPPVQGVYIVRMHGIQTHAIPGVANVGSRPTVDGANSLLEVYLFDFNTDIYGQYVTIEFCEKLRDEKRFANLDLLVDQINNDAKLAREYFKTRGELT
jgi:riboflavin kinase/FMN adenylyltransferase